MSKVPSDLSAKIWSKVKPSAVKDKAFATKLDAYAAASAKIEKQATREIASFNEAIAALEAISKAIPAEITQSAKDKEGVKTLEGYKTLVAKESQRLANEYQIYLTNVKNWIEIRNTSLRELTNLLVEAKGSKINASLERARKFALAKQADLASKLLVKCQEELAALEEKAVSALSKSRVPGPAKLEPHGHDKGVGPTVFQQAMAKMDEFYAFRDQLRGDLAKVAKLVA